MLHPGGNGATSQQCALAASWSALMGEGGKCLSSFSCHTFVYAPCPEVHKGTGKPQSKLSEGLE